MKLPPFEYACPATIAEAVALLASHPGDAKVIAGGQSLMPMMAFRLATPSLLVDLRKLEGLDRIEIGKEGIRIGAKVRWRDILDSAALRKAHPLLVAAIGHVAHYQIRNRGTVGGSLAHADPAAEMPGIAVACDALIFITGKAGSRVLRAQDFFLGALTTALQPDELITEIRLPLWPSTRRWGFEEFARRRGDFALAAVAVFYDEDGLGRSKDAHIGVIGASNRPLRIKEAEALLNGRALTEALMVEAGCAVSAAVNPFDDIHASAAYRRALAGTLTERALVAGGRRRPMTQTTLPTRFTVNGKPAEVSVPARMTLADCLRHQLRLTGTHLGCEHGVCGACTVIVNGDAVRACLMLAVQAEGADIVTVEGLSNDDALTPLQASFRKHGALQCGFCTPGMITTAHALLSEEPEADADRIRDVLSGNLCRCTGYIPIVEAVLDARAAYRKTGET